MIPELTEARRAGTAGARLRAIRGAAPRFRDRFAAGPKARIRTFDLASFPYPTRFGLWGCAAGLARLSPFLLLTHRMNVVDFGGKRLLMNPTDIDAAMATPFFDSLLRRFGRGVSVRMLSTRHGRAETYVDPATVDYVTFDHLHVQDLRPIVRLYPKAKILVQRAEWESVCDLHPIQKHWYVPGGCEGIPPDRMTLLDGDTELGDGVALLFTPGHTAGNHTLCVNTGEGVFCIAENGVAADCYNPRKSGIPGLARFARYYDLEAVLNANTVQGAEEQYTSMVLEKLVAGPCARNPDFFNVCPSSELTRWWLSPGTAPTFSHGRLRSGE